MLIIENIIQIIIYNKLVYNNMSEDKIDHQDDLKGASRRSRKDEQGRDYVCGCGKKYLSYPALYTHIKTKHDGHQPEGTQKTGIAPVIRRTKQKIDQKVLKEIQNLVQIQNLKILTQLDENAQGLIPMNNRIKKQLLNKQLFQAHNSLTKITNINAIDKKSPLETVLVFYLIGAGQFTSQAMFLYYCNFAKLFRNCFHQHGLQVWESCFKKQDNKKERHFSVDQCKMAPIICDFFLRFYIPFQAPHQSKNEDFLNVMELICCDFCQWMYLNKFSIVEVSLKKKYQVLRANLIQPKSKDKKSEFDKQNEDYKEDKQQSQEHLSSIDQSQGDKKQLQKNKQEQKRAIDDQQMCQQEQNAENSQSKLKKQSQSAKV